MKITRTGRGEFVVESRSNPEFPHHVDMEELGGVGICSCSDHRFRCQHNYNDCLRLGIDPFIHVGDFRTFCAHTQAVWDNYGYTKEFAREQAKLYAIKQK